MDFPRPAKTRGPKTLTLKKNRKKDKNSLVNYNITSITKE